MRARARASSLTSLEGMSFVRNSRPVFTQCGMSSRYTDVFGHCTRWIIIIIIVRLERRNPSVYLRSKSHIFFFHRSRSIVNLVIRAVTATVAHERPPYGETSVRQPTIRGDSPSRISETRPRCTVTRLL